MQYGVFGGEIIVIVPNNNYKTLEYYLFLFFFFEKKIMNNVAATPQRTAREISTRIIVRHGQTVVEMCESTSACSDSQSTTAGTMGSRQRRRRWRRQDRPQTTCPRPSPSPMPFFFPLLFLSLILLFSALVSMALPRHTTYTRWYSHAGRETLHKLTCVTRSEFSIVPARNVTAGVHDEKLRIIILLIRIDKIVIIIILGALI